MLPAAARRAGPAAGKGHTGAPPGAPTRARVGPGARGAAPPPPRAEPPSGGGGRSFADFVAAPATAAGGPVDKAAAEAKAQQLIDRAAEVLARTRQLVEDVRRRAPADPARRLPPSELSWGAPVPRGAEPAAAAGGGPSPGAAAAAAAGRGAPGAPGGAPQPGGATRQTMTAWEKATGAAAGAPRPGSSARGGGGVPAAGSRPGGGGWAPTAAESRGAEGGGARSGSIDGWFAGKVAAGGAGGGPAPVGGGAPRPVPQAAPAARPAPAVAVMERPARAGSLEFGAPAAPAESQAGSIFPQGLALRFQSDTEAEAEAAAAAAAAAAPAPADEHERRSGEEFGPNGYWCRWTEARGRSADGASEWYERWWEASDWRGMRELGAEKWGHNARGDAWRETWREAIGFDEATRQPTVERTAHKFAHNAAGQEWEEAWGEAYWSAGRADKWADKWGRDGGEVWHEKWGEQYDGAGGCVKWTDKWAERQHADGSRDKWGDKWEERFKDGVGGKTGETWSESAGGERFNRWWGEDHGGGGRVRRHGHSTAGEAWDAVEEMDTYYNPIPHFGYDLALAHSPRLREVATLPRDAGGLEGGGLDALL